MLINIEIKFVFDFKATLHPLKTLHTSCLNVFKEKEPKCIVNEKLSGDLPAQTEQKKH